MKEEPIVTNFENFDITTINYLLNKLKEKGIINNDELNKLTDIYMKDSRNLKDKIEEIQKLDKEKIMNLLNKINKKTEETKISLENITEFQKNDTKRRYISIHYPMPDNKIKVIENNTDKSAKDIFESLKDSAGLVMLDGFVNSFDVFDQKLRPEKIEVKIYDITELCLESNFNKLTIDQKEIVTGTVISIINNISGLSEEKRQKLMNEPVENIIKIFNKRLYLSPEENIVIISDENSISNDEIKALAKDKNGNYKLVGLTAKGYDYVNNELSNNNDKTDENYEHETESYENDENEKKKEDVGRSYFKKKRTVKSNDNKLLEKY